MEGEDTKTPETNISSENFDKESKNNVLESTGSEVEEVIEEDQKDDNEAEKLQDIQPEEELKELSEKDRLVMYEKGVRLKRKGNNGHALPCFLSCLQGLKERDRFPVLPECLHNIAEIYSQEEEYEAAIKFAQAEKLYYETALITVDRDNEESVATDCVSGTDRISAEPQGSSSTSSNEAAQKAEEYEKLAHMCLKQQNPQLALDYCAKAVKIQQSCYGEQHPVTLKTLDLFTVIYAEMGKQQYKAALEKFSAAQEKETKPPKETTEEEAASVSTTNVTQAKPCTKETDQTVGTKMEDIKRSDDQEQPGNTTEETTPTSQDTVKLTMTSSQALILYFIITIILAIVLTTMLCYVTQTDLKTTYNYMLTRIRFYYYYYFKRKESNRHHYF